MDYPLHSSALISFVLEWLHGMDRVDCMDWIDKNIKAQNLSNYRLIGL